MKEVKYIPSKTVAAFMGSDKTIRAIIGPFGSGKSVGCVMEILKMAVQQEPDSEGVRRTRIAVIRNTVEELKQTTIKTMQQWLPDGVAGEYVKYDKTFYLGAGKKNKTYISLSDGTKVSCEIIFLGLDRPDQVRDLLSLDITSAWINEFREVPYEIFRAVLGRIGRYPAKPTAAKIIMDSNPFSEDSVWYQIFEEGGDEIEDTNLTIGLWKQPGGLSEGAENKEYLPPNYYENMVVLAKKKGKDNNWVNIHVHGKYGQLVSGRGIYADDYNEEKHLSPVTIKPDYNYKIGLGFDFGLTPAIAIAQNINGKWHILHEITSDNMGMVQLIEVLKEYLYYNYGKAARYLGFGDPAGQQRNQYDLKTAFSAIRAQGIPVQPSTQSPMLRKEGLRAILRREGGFMMNKDCKMLRRGLLGAYRWRKVRTSEERYEEKPEKTMESHICEALEYLVAPFESGNIQYNKDNRTFPGPGENNKIILTESWNIYE